MNKLVYLHAAFCETLRLYPPIPFNHKAAVDTDVLPSGHHVKKNMRIMLSFYSMARLEEIWGIDSSQRDGFPNKEALSTYHPTSS